MVSRGSITRSNERKTEQRVNYGSSEEVFFFFYQRGSIKLWNRLANKSLLFEPLKTEVDWGQHKSLGEE